MPALTLKGLPYDLMERLRELAHQERRSLNQQAILLLERAVADSPTRFGTAYDRFRETHGASPLEEDDLAPLRSSETGRPVDL